MKDDGPYKTECQLGVSIYDVFWSYVDQFDLRTMQKISLHQDTYV